VRFTTSQDIHLGAGILRDPKEVLSQNICAPDLGGRC
jgi:hypothetical protein